MRFITHGEKYRKSLLLIHGMGNTSDLFDPILPYLGEYFVIVCELDGHSPSEDSDFSSITAESEAIENYVKTELDGKLYGLLGFSLGGTIAVELLARGNIAVERTVLDAAYILRMGVLTYPYKWMFQGSIWCLEKNLPLPKVGVEAVMGKGNIGITDTIYRGVSMRSIHNVCMDLFTYELKPAIQAYKNPIVFWHGENEPYPVISARLLKKYVPQLRKRVFRNMGHGQMLREHPRVYAKRMIDFLV